MNFGWEYVYHCHILSHEEMDMMRPVSLALPPNKVTGVSAKASGNGANARVDVTWTDNSINETDFQVQRSVDGVTWQVVGTVSQPLVNNTHGARSYSDRSVKNGTGYAFRVLALNRVGYGSGFPTMTVSSVSDAVATTVGGVTAPTGLTAAVLSGPAVKIGWNGTATGATKFAVQRSTNNGGSWTNLTPQAGVTGSTFTDTAKALRAGRTYAYRVGSVSGNTTAWSVLISVTIAAPPRPAAVQVGVAPVGRVSDDDHQARIATVTWSDVVGEYGYKIQWRGGHGKVVRHQKVGADVTSLAAVAGHRIRYVRIGAANALGIKWSKWVRVPFE